MTAPSPQMSKDELNQAIVDASRQYIAVARAYPRDTAKIAAARAALDDLIALRDRLYP